MDTLVEAIEGTELFLIHGKVLASQPAYLPAFIWQAHHRETLHFYCPRCGEVWGMRVNTEAKPTEHHYYKEKCKPCGGAPDMLLSWERAHPAVPSAQVLANIFLYLTEDLENETEISRD